MFSPEDGSSMCAWNVGIHQQDFIIITGKNTIWTDTI
jgi:hypothetical protein